MKKTSASWNRECRAAFRSTQIAGALCAGCLWEALACGAYDERGLAVRRSLTRAQEGDGR